MSPGKLRAAYPAEPLRDRERRPAMLSGCRIIVFLAGLAGAAGVVLSAVAAHVAGGTVLATGATFLILHSGSAVGVAALALRVEGKGRTILLLSAAAMLLGASLFCGDVALRALMDTGLLWGTAPTGGTLAILGWLGLAAGAVAAGRDRRTTRAS